MTQHRSIPARFRALDAWRGICALLVVLLHAPTLHALKGTAAFENLQLCVDFFFVLSGFVISHAYRHRLGDAASGVSFLWARFWRLWPLHVVVLAIFVVFEMMKFVHAAGGLGGDLHAAPFAEGHSPFEIVTNLLFLQAFGLHSGLTWNGPAWSIAAEFWVSLVFALVLCLPARGRTLAFAALALVSAALIAVVSPATLFVTYDWGFLRCVLGFAVGCVVYDLRLRFAAPKLALGAAEIACVVLAAAFALLTPQGPVHLLAPLLFAGLIYVFSFEAGPVSRLMAGPVPQALGRWSFAIYMTHMLVVQVERTLGGVVGAKLGLDLVVIRNGDKYLVFGDGLQTLLVTLAVIALVVVPVGAFFHRFVERPLARWSARLGAARGKGAARPVPPGLLPAE